MNKIRSIRTKLILMILSANLLLVVPMIFFIQYTMQKEFETSLFHNFNQVQKLSINLLSIERKGDEALLNLLVSDPLLQHSLMIRDATEVHVYLEEKRRALGLKGLILLDKELHLLTDRTRSKMLEPLLQSGLLKKAETFKCAASEILSNEEDLLRYVVVPVLKEGVVTGMLVGMRRIEVGSLKQMTKNTEIALALLEGETVMVSTLEGLRAQKKLPIDPQRMAWLLEHPSQSIKMAIGQGSYYISTYIIHQEHQKRPLLLLLAVKESAFCKAFNVVIKSIIITFVVALLIIAIFIIVLSHKIQLLFNEFIIFTQQIKLGDYKTKMEMNTNDEFQALAQNLDEMRQAIYEQEQSLQVYAETLGTEVDERTRRLRAQNSYLQTILDIQDELIIVINEKGLTYANQACLNFWGVKELNELKKFCKLYEFFGYENMESFSELLKRGEPFTKNIDFEKGAGERLFFEVKFYPIEDSSYSYMVILNDVTAHAKEKLQLYQQATRDTLTNLPNRYDFENKLTYVLEQIKRTREDAVFCLVDIDNFKSVNDTYGHLVGDQVLIKVAATLQENIRQSDLIARWGGEEFVIVLYPTTFSNARTLLELLRKKIQETFSDYSWKLTCSFGATVLMYDSNIDFVFKQADEALYEAKASGKNCVHFSIDIDG